MYRQITPAEGWHFVSQEEPSGRLIVFPLAAWGLVEDGSAVVGLVGDVRGGGNISPGASWKNMLRLVAVPPITGQYKHVSTMTAAELAALKPKEPDAAAGG